MVFGSKIEEIITEEGLEEDILFRKYGYPDEFIKHGSVGEIEKKYGLDVESISNDIRKFEK